MNKELNINSRTTGFASPAESYVQETLFNSNIIDAPIPETKVKMWEMRQDFKTYHYTTDWDEIPNVFV
jgi:hypothetical protein